MKTTVASAREAGAFWRDLEYDFLAGNMCVYDSSMQKRTRCCPSLPRRKRKHERTLRSKNKSKLDATTTDGDGLWPDKDKDRGRVFQGLQELQDCLLIFPVWGGPNLENLASLE